MIHWEKMVISAHKKKNDYDPNVGKILNINQKKKSLFFKQTPTAERKYA